MFHRITQIRGVKSFYAGLIYVVLGGVAFVWSHDYEIGDATHMGPGYFPALLGICLVGIGLISVVNGYRSKAIDPISKHKLEPLILVLASIVSFSVLIESAGLVVAIFVSVLLVCFRRALTNPLEVFLTFLVLVVFSAVVFVHFFGMVIPLFWWD